MANQYSDARPTAGGSILDTTPRPWMRDHGASKFATTPMQPARPTGAAVQEQDDDSVCDAATETYEPTPITVLDLRAVDDAPTPMRDANTFDGASPTPTTDPKPRPVGPGWGAMLTSAGWVSAAIGVPTAILGPDVLFAIEPLTLAGLGALTIAPPIVILACSSAAREAYRARLEQHRLSRFARRVMLGPDDMHGRANAIGQSMRSEIQEINESISGALDRMAQLEAAAIRNAHAFEDAVSSAKLGASALSNALNEERSAFSTLNQDLQNQTEQLGATVARQIRMMREAAHLVRQETARADQNLTANIAALATSTATLGDKTEALNSVVANAANGARRIDETLGVALEALGETTKLNDSARKAAEVSAVTAQQAAQAVRDASVRAAADARRVTEIIRAETKAMQEQAAATLETLRAAADEARRAAEVSEAVAEKYTPQSRRAAQQPGVSAKSTAQSGAAFVTAQPANDVHPGDVLRERAVRLVEDTGVDLETVFTTADLDYVAGRSKDGPSARRRAVSLAAMDAVERIGQRLALDNRARDTATAFRSKPDLAAKDSGRAALKAYLLLDAALG